MIKREDLRYKELSDRYEKLSLWVSNEFGFEKLDEILNKNIEDLENE